MSTARCPTCHTLRPANASYCPNCGTPLTAAITPAPASTPAADTDQFADLIPSRISVDMSVFTGVKFGAGFAIGATLVSLILFVLVVGAISAGLR